MKPKTHVPQGHHSLSNRELLISHGGCTVTLREDGNWEVDSKRAGLFIGCGTNWVEADRDDKSRLEPASEHAIPGLNMIVTIEAARMFADRRAAQAAAT